MLATALAARQLVAVGESRWQDPDGDTQGGWECVRELRAVERGRAGDGRRYMLRVTLSRGLLVVLMARAMNDAGALYDG